jgi:hypothetical protein
VHLSQIASLVVADLVHHRIRRLLLHRLPSFFLPFREVEVSGFTPDPVPVRTIGENALLDGVNELE